jgi:DNA polymerase III delta subunit
MAKLLSHRVILITGNEDVLRREALASLIKETGVLPDDFDLETFTADASSPLDWVASVGTSPFLAERRIAVVRHVLRCDLDKAKKVDFSKLPESSLLILVADEEGGSEDRERKMQSNRTAWQKIVRESGGFVVTCDTDSKTLQPLVKKRAAEMGKTISDRAVQVLVEMTGESLSRALDELEKLVLFVGAQDQISESEVRRVVVPSRDWSVYKMVDGIFSGDVGVALRQLRTLIGSVKDADGAAYGRILPTVSRQLRLMWQGRLCVEAKCGPGNAPESIRAMFPDRANLAAEYPSRQTAVMNLARKISFERLNRCFGILADTDARLKGALDAFTPLETLERMILEMAHT